jgi:hypothetical protein
MLNIFVSTARAIIDDEIGAGNGSYTLIVCVHQKKTK